MSRDDAPKKQPKAHASFFNIRDSLPSLEAIKRYDSYLKDLKRCLSQLEREARGDMAPSDEWYRED